jgi:hypothetical protein
MVISFVPSAAGTTRKCSPISASLLGLAVAAAKEWKEIIAIAQPTAQATNTVLCVFIRFTFLIAHQLFSKNAGRECDGEIEPEEQETKPGCGNKLEHSSNDLALRNQLPSDSHKPPKPHASHFTATTEREITSLNTFLLL